MRLPAAAYSATDRRHGHTIAKGAESTPSTLSVPADREGHYVLLLRGHLGRCAPPMHDDVLNERRRIPPIRPHTEAPLTRTLGRSGSLEWTGCIGSSMTGGTGSSAGSETSAGRGL